MHPHMLCYFDPCKCSCSVPGSFLGTHAALHGIFSGGASRQGEVPWCVPCQQGGEIGVWSKGGEFGVSDTLGGEIVESSHL